MSDSLGGKGVLWELFSFNPPSLQLYVELCATSQFLSEILISNPGMIDELLDSLVLNKLPTLDELRRELAELCRGAEDSSRSCTASRTRSNLRVGVRDILGKEDIQATTGALSRHRRGLPASRSPQREYRQAGGEVRASRRSATGRAPGEPCELVILALGKLGGRELNYHSDLDLIFLYEADGTTVHARRSRRSGETTTNQHFFSELGQRIIKVASHLGPYGRLYEIDPRLRPTGKQRQPGHVAGRVRALLRRGRGPTLGTASSLHAHGVVYGSDEAAQAAMEAVAQAAFDQPWQPEHADAIRDMRAAAGRNQPASATSSAVRAAGRHRVPGADAASSSTPASNPRLRVAEHPGCTSRAA